jgi:hypothetical protein
MLDERTERRAAAGRVQARWRDRRMACWTAWAVAVLALFVVAWHEARQMAVQSDGASIALQAWQMLHGNLLLRGWHVTDVSFYTTELPVYMLVEAVRGLRVDVPAISAALNYTLLVVLAALVAMGQAQGRTRIVRAVLAAGIMLAPSLVAARWLLNNSDHAATPIWVLLALLVIDRCGRRWYVPVVVGAVLAWAIVGDPLVEVIGAAPLAVVCLVRGWQGLVRRREPLQSWWFELSLAAAAVCSVAVAVGAMHVIRALGGWVPDKVVSQFVTSVELLVNLGNTFENFLGLFSADFFGNKISVGLIPVVIHLAGACLVALAIWLALRVFPRGPDFVAAVLAAGIVCNLAAYIFLYRASVGNIREIAPVFALGAALVGRVLGPPLVRSRLEPFLAAGLACYLLTLGPAVTGRPLPPADLALSRWLEQHRLDSGIAGYWQANSVVLDSGTKITMRPVIPRRGGKTLMADLRELDVRLLNPGTNYANFLVATAPGTFRGQTVTEAQGIATFGKPAYVYRFKGYRILVWDKNLLRILGNR